HKKIHRLAIEDLINTTNRTKADWYSDHAYVVLTLQKLIRLQQNKGKSEEEEAEDQTPPQYRERKGSMSSEKASVSMKRLSRRDVILEALRDIFKLKSWKPRHKIDESTGTSVRPAVDRASSKQASHLG